MSSSRRSKANPEAQEVRPTTGEDSSPIPSEIAEPAAQYRTEVMPYPEHVAWLVGQELNRLETQYAGLGRSLAELGAPQELAERMVSTLPSPSPWDDLIGPFYGPAQIARLLGDVSRQAVADRRQRRTLLGLKTADGHWVYPIFQFDRHNRVISGLPELLRILAASGIDDWSLAGWLASPLRSLGGRTPIEWLRNEGDPETLRAVTRDAAHRFAQ